MPKITKHGEDFYVIERLSCRGHRDNDGRILAGPSEITFAFRRPEDPAHINLDPVDVLQVLIEHLGDGPAVDHLEEAQRLLSYTKEVAARDSAVRSGAIEQGTAPPPPKRSHKKKPLVAA